MLQIIKLKNNLVFTFFIVCVQVAEVIGCNYSFLKTQDCDCYILGTIGSIEEKSICNSESLQCKCHPNILGKNCDQCMVGYYNIFSGYGCVPCNCNSIGASKNVCDKYTGQCLCKPGYIGLKCDQCDYDIYQRYMLNCATRYLNLHNSRKHQSNETACLGNIEGNLQILANTCRENFYISEGCGLYTACYFVVQDELNDYEDYFNFTINIIKNNYYPLYVTKYQLFITQISDLKILVQNLEFKYEHNLKFYKIEVITDRLVQETEYLFNKILNMMRLANEIFDYNIIQQHRKYINAGITESQNLIQENKELLENSTIVSTTTSKYSNKMTAMLKDVLEILNNIEKKVDDIRFISNNTLQMCNETCKLNATHFKISIQVHYKLLSTQYDIIKANKRIKSIYNYIKNIQNKTIFTELVTENLKSQIFQTKIFSKNFIFSELNMSVTNFSKINKSLQHITKLYNTFIENQDFLNKTLKHAQVKIKQIHNGSIKLNYYKNRSDEAMGNFEILKSSVEVVQLNYKELEKLKIKSFNIYDQSTAILKTYEDITNIFENITVVVKFINNFQPGSVDISQSINDNQGNMEINLKTVYGFDQQQAENIKLNECHKQLNNVKEELHHLITTEYKYKNNIKFMKEYLTVLNILPTSHKQLNKIERDIETMEEIISRIYYLNRLLAQRNQLQQQVNNIKAIIESLPDDVSTLCEAAQTEPKLNLN